MAPRQICTFTLRTRCLWFGLIRHCLSLRRLCETASAKQIIYACLILLGAAFGRASEPRALIVAGMIDHPPGTHEAAAGARLIAYCLEHLENLTPIHADVVGAWPRDAASLGRYSIVVFLGDLFPAVRMPESEVVMRDLAIMAERGCGIVCIHFAVGLNEHHLTSSGDHPLLRWIGGYFAVACSHHQSVARIYEMARIEPADPEHPISRGCAPFILQDEPYINNYFGSDPNGLLPGAFAVAVSMLPPDSPKREIIAWGIQRPDFGRGFGVTLPHYYKNWQIDALRKFILNGIVWTAKREIPPEGEQTTLPDLRDFLPGNVEPPPSPRPPVKK